MRGWGWTRLGAPLRSQYKTHPMDRNAFSFGTIKDLYGVPQGVEVAVWNHINEPMVLQVFVWKTLCNMISITIYSEVP